MNQKFDALTGRHVGLVNVHVNNVHSTSGLHLPFMLFDHLVANQLSTSIHLHENDSDGDRGLGEQLARLKSIGVLIDQDELVSRDDLYKVIQSSVSALHLDPRPEDLNPATLRALEFFGAQKDYNDFMDKHRTIYQRGWPNHAFEDSHRLWRNMHLLHVQLEYDLMSEHLSRLGYLPENADSYSFSAGLPYLEKGETFKAMSVVFDNVPIPHGIPWDELRDLKNERAYRDSIKAFRRWASEIIGDKVPNAVLRQEVKDSLADLDLLIARHKTDRVLAVVKFILGNIGGIAEDIVKFRFESAANRPFVVTETILDAIYEGPAYYKHPLYFAARIKDAGEAAQFRAG